MEKPYVCPMHPEVESEKEGRCSKCGMKLVLKDSLNKTTTVSHHTNSESNWKDYIPLVVIISLILLTSLTISTRDIQLGAYSWKNTIEYFMIGFFLVFSGFKLMDLKGFAEGYSTYDLLAKRVFNYGYVYPFIELLFGIAMILNSLSRGLLWAEFFVMAFSGIGVALKLLRHERFQCACLGTFLKVPLTKVTLIEDFGMAFLALILLSF